MFTSFNSVGLDLKLLVQLKEFKFQPSWCYLMWKKSKFATKSADQFIGEPLIYQYFVLSKNHVFRVTWVFKSIYINYVWNLSDTFFRYYIRLIVFPRLKIDVYIYITKKLLNLPATIFIPFIVKILKEVVIILCTR